MNNSINEQKISNQCWLSPNLEVIPEQLKKQPWAVWCAEQREGKPGKFNKAPLHPLTGKKIGANKPEQFSSFDDVKEGYSSGKYTGIGVLLTGNGIVGVDIDDYLSVFDNQPSVKNWVFAAVGEGIYCEYSPSGTGLRLFMKGKLPSSGRKSSGLEIYDDKRFLTVTGHVFDARKVGI